MEAWEAQIRPRKPFPSPILGVKIDNKSYKIASIISPPIRTVKKRYGRFRGTTDARSTRDRHTVDERSTNDRRATDARLTRQLLDPRPARGGKEGHKAPLGLRKVVSKDYLSTPMARGLANLGAPYKSSKASIIFYLSLKVHVQSGWMGWGGWIA